MTAQKKQNPLPGKKLYAAPKLIEYGNIVELTAGGALGGDEGSMISDLTRKL